MKHGVIAELARQFPDLVGTAGAYCFAKDREGRYLFANEAVCHLFGTTATQLLGKDDSHYVDLALSPELRASDRRVLEAGEEVHAQEWLTLRSGEVRVFWSIKLPLRGADGQVRGLVGIASDITHTRVDTEQLARRNEVLSSVLAHVDAYVYMKAHDGTYLYANPRVAELYGRSVDEILGRTDDELHPPEIAAQLQRLDRTVLATRSRVATQEVVGSASARQHHFWSIKMPVQLPGEPMGLMGFSTDITELLELRRNLEEQRSRDPLTGLSSRQRFEEDLDIALAQAERDRHATAVVVLNVDQFKYINNSLGQALGDQLLTEIANRLRAERGIEGGIARLFGDEFAFAVPHFATAGNVSVLVERVREALNLPYDLGGKPLHLTVSAGVSIYPDDGRESSTLIGHAETAMHHAKDGGRNRHQFFAPAIGEAVSQRLQLEGDLRAALASMAFELHYQPKMRADGSIDSFEALIRWQRPGHGPVSPAVFIPLAEQLGLVDAIGAWVVEQACRQMAAWRDAGLGQVQVAVNLSPSQLRDPAFVGWVAQVRSAHGIAPAQLEMEVTESMMMHDPEQAISALAALRNADINLAIDDFGTGYSSMAYLKRIPVNTLKLDRVFVAQVDTDRRDADICAGMIALAHNLGLQVVAEGVETQAQRDALAERNCDVFQGYLFSRPLPAADATRFLVQAQQTPEPCVAP